MNKEHNGCAGCKHEDKFFYEQPCLECKQTNLDCPDLWEDASDIVNHPSHYCQEGSMEAIDEMILVFGKEATMNFCLLNVWKYRKRAVFKNGEEDMKKSDWYMNKYKELSDVTEETEDVDPKLMKALLEDYAPYDVYVDYLNGNKTSMTGNDYQKLASRTINQDLDEKSQMYHALHGMVGELGEIHSIFQKFYQGHDIDKEHLKKELGDLLWFIAEFCTALGLKLEDVMQMNIDKLKKRYPDGFDIDKSLHRAEGDI